MKTKPEQRILNVLPSRNTQDNWTLATARSAGLIKRPRKIPEAVDLRTSKRYWKIQNQGQTGACVGFSVAYGLLWWHRPEWMPSARFTWMGSKESDVFTKWPTSFCEMSGTYISGALNFSRKYGSIPDKMLRMRDETTKTAEQVIYAKAASNRIQSYHKLNGPDEWKTWIATQGPIVCRLAPDFQFYSAGKRKLENYVPQGFRSGAHAVVLSGYGPDLFVVRNSWGTRWGHRGYCYVSKAYAEAAFSEAYGVAV